MGKSKAQVKDEVLRFVHEARPEALGKAGLNAPPDLGEYVTSEDACKLLGLRLRRCWEVMKHAGVDRRMVMNPATHVEYSVWRRRDVLALRDRRANTRQLPAPAAAAETPAANAGAPGCYAVSVQRPLTVEAPPPAATTDNTRWVVVTVAGVTVEVAVEDAATVRVQVRPPA